MSLAMDVEIALYIAEACVAPACVGVPTGRLPPQIAGLLAEAGLHDRIFRFSDRA